MNRRKGLFANLVFSNQIIEAGISAWGSVALRSVGTLAVLLLGVAGAQAATFPNENVGTSSAGQAISVTATRAGTVNTINVLTLGQANLDFNADSLPADSGLTTCTGETLSIGQNCKVGVIFTPTAPGTRFGAVVLLDVNNKVLGTGYASVLASVLWPRLSPATYPPLPATAITWELSLATMGRQRAPSCIFPRPLLSMAPATSTSPTPLITA